MKKGTITKTKLKGSSRAASPRRNSIFSSTPAFFQYRRAMEVHVSSWSKQTSVPPAGNPRAMLSELLPVNVPTSTARRAPMAATRNVRKPHC